MKKLKPRRYVIIGDTTYYHGDYITACIDRQDEDNEDRCDIELEDARICINKEADNQEGERHFSFWICQNEREGCSNADTTFEFKYSWVAKVNKDGDIISEDTEWVQLESRSEPDLEVEEKDIQVVEQEEEDFIDDDPMPEDWTPSEKDIQFLRK